jgi:hypothetical protein
MKTGECKTHNANDAFAFFQQHKQTKHKQRKQSIIVQQHERATHERKIKLQSPQKLTTRHYVCNNRKIHSKDKAAKS